MGGPGSGSWSRFGRKTTVEECLTIDANRWMRDGSLREGLCISGSRVWSNNRGEKTDSIDYRLNTLDPNNSQVRLFYTITRPNEEKQEIDFSIQLQTTSLNFGGLRWWFTCPLVTGRTICNRRVAKLYSPPSALYFGCLACYDLTYTSCQVSHRYDRMFARLAEGHPSVTVKSIKELIST